MAVFYWTTTAEFTASQSAAWALTGGSYFYLPSPASTGWSTTAEYTFVDRDLWFAKRSGVAEDPNDFKGVAEAPEDYDILPTDIDILPPETQADNEDWTDVEGQNRAAGSGWTIVSDD